MENSIIKSLRLCNTRESWNSFFASYEQEVLKDTTGKKTELIFQRIQLDHQPELYLINQYEILLQATIRNDNLELGDRIWNYCKKIPSAALSILATSLYSKMCKPKVAREIALRSLRFKNLTSEDRMSLELAVSQSYAEEGKTYQANKRLRGLDKYVVSAKLSTESKARFFYRAAATFFYIGESESAAKHFKESANLSMAAENYYEASKSYFNCASSLYNLDSYLCFEYIGRSAQIAEKYKYTDIESHIKAFHALHHYHLGNFSKAISVIAEGLEKITSNKFSYLQIHLLSTQSIVLLAQGNYKQAQKSIQRTLIAAEKDLSKRWSTRYIQLTAELLWQKGNVEKCLKLLKHSIQKFVSNPTQTLEESTAFNLYFTKISRIGTHQISQEPQWSKFILSNPFFTMDYNLAKAKYSLNHGDPKLADQLLRKTLAQSIKTRAQYHEARARVGLAQLQLSQGKIGNECLEHIRQAEEACTQVSPSNLDVKTHLLYAGYHYQRGKFEESLRQLKYAEKVSTVEMLDSIAIRAWIEVCQGKSPQLQKKWQTNAFSRCTQIYFKPSLELVQGSTIVISKHYKVALGKYPILFELLCFLMSKASKSASLSQIQKAVWNQSTEQIGFEQKIRNALMRFRQIAKFSMAPVLVQKNDIRLFHEAIQFKQISNGKKSVQNDNIKIIKELILNGFDTSNSLSSESKLSLSTVKRTLKKMAASGDLKIKKEGRNVQYQLNNKQN